MKRIPKKLLNKNALSYEVNKIFFDKFPKIDTDYNIFF